MFPSFLASGKTEKTGEVALCPGSDALTLLRWIPKLYLFQTIPVLVPKSFIVSLCSLAIRFLRNSGLSRVKYNLLTLPKLQRSAGLPDYELNYKATLMAHILEWFPCS